MIYCGRNKKMNDGHWGVCKIVNDGMNEWEKVSEETMRQINYFAKTAVYKVLICGPTGQIMPIKEKNKTMDEVGQVSWSAPG